MIEKKVYMFKDKPYQILTESKIKIGDTWEDVIIYKCLYLNIDGMLWVRFKKEFEEKFKLHK